MDRLLHDMASPPTSHQLGQVTNPKAGSSSLPQGVTLSLHPSPPLRLLERCLSCRLPALSLPAGDDHHPSASPSLSSWQFLLLIFEAQIYASSPPSLTAWQFQLPFAALSPAALSGCFGRSWDPSE